VRGMSRYSVVDNEGAFTMATETQRAANATRRVLRDLRVTP
jgi:hypothetical protein